MLAVIETHPVQYHAPVYRSVQQDFDIPVTAIYGSDFSVAGYEDREFQTKFAWDSDLLSGYTSVFLSRVARGATASDTKVKTLGLREALMKLQPKTILLPGYSPRFYQVAFFDAHRTRKPLLFRGETTDHARARSGLKIWLRDRALRWLYKRCARLLYIGRRSKAHFLRLGVPESKLIVSPYCVDVAPFQSEEADRDRLRAPVRQHLQIRDSDVAVLFSGKLSGRKGPDLLVSAMKSIEKTVRERLVLLFVGDGELRNALAVAVGQTPAVRSHFFGFQNQTQLSRCYHAADLLALPSVSSETWGLVVNEALHHGVPCVVSDAVGCAPDLVTENETGAVCETASQASLAAALERALKLVHRPEVRAACRRRVASYSVRRAAEGIAQAYREVVNTHG
jgi:glycosyltransferase involved in cell wall biosynthesis